MTAPRAFRTRLHLTQERLGALLGVTGRTIHAWESGARPLDPTAARLLELLDAVVQTVDVEALARAYRRADLAGEVAYPAAAANQDAVVRMPLSDPPEWLVEFVAELLARAYRRTPWTT